MKVKTFLVGGAVRDQKMGVDKIKDLDFSMEGFESLHEMEDHLVSEGFEIHTVTPDKFTIRVGIPKDNPLRARAKDADFVMCRKEGPYSDGRRPDWVESGTIFDDLARRDFTINAMAIDCDTDEFLDPHNGMEDLRNNTLRFVGDPLARITEDGLRIMRAFRFTIVRGFVMEPETLAAVTSFEAERALLNDSISVERIREELNKMLKHDTVGTLRFLHHFLPPSMFEVVFKDNLRLEATLKG